MISLRQSVLALLATAVVCVATPARAEVAPPPAPTDPATAPAPTDPAAAPARPNVAAGEPAAMRLPLAAAQRPLTLPRLILSPRLDFDVTHNVGGVSGYLDGAMAFGLTDDFEMNVLFVPLRLWAPNSGVQYGEVGRIEGPSLGALYRFVRGRFELGLGVDARAFTIPNVSGFSVAPTLPLRFHATDKLRLDLTLTVEFVHETVTTTNVVPGPAAITVTPGSVVLGTGVTAGSIEQNPVRLFVPLGLVYNLEDSVHVGANTGLTIYDLSDSSNTMGIPLGVSGGYAIAGPSGPVLDINPFFNFPYLLMPGRKSIDNAQQWVVGLNLIGHIYL
jgi:hypothetical protein